MAHFFWENCIRFNNERDIITSNRHFFRVKHVLCSNVTSIKSGSNQDPHLNSIRAAMQQPGRRSTWTDCLNRTHQMFCHRSKNIVKGVVIVGRSFGHSGPGKSASIQLYSRTEVDHNTRKGKLSEHAHLKDGKKSKNKGLKIITYKVKFYLEQEFGIPGAFLITSRLKHEFFLLSATLQLTTNGHNVHFDCNSWIYPISKTKTARLFFSNASYLPNQTPEALRELREEELQSLRGDGQGKRLEWDRIYDYDVYNDLGDPDHGDQHVRPILGGTNEFPYPRRVRTGRPRSEADNRIESRPKIISLDTYVPADERFSPVKFSEFITHSIAAIVHFLIPEAKSMFQGDPGFESFKQIYDLYEEPRHQILEGWLSDILKKMVPKHIAEEFVRLSKDNPVKFRVPQIIAENQMAWRDDEEFGRETLAGLNPAAIECLKVFPPNDSSFRVSHIQPNLDGISVDSAMERHRLFILDHHHYLLPCLELMLMNEDERCVYASRTIFFRRDDMTMKPVAIELTRADPDEPELGISRVFVPAAPGTTDRALWHLAKAHVAVNDSAHHQLISHWLKTHAVVEPFIIATKRQLSVMHPVHKLLEPHFKDTMFINSTARSILINSEGILERTMFPGEFSMALSSSFYREHWTFHEQALPVDLLKRGMAVEDPNHPSGVRLLFDDYPYGADGLEIWRAIKTWVTAYCSVYYPNDTSVSSDSEIQAWWSEVQHIGHGDKSANDWWPPKLLTIPDLVQTLTTLIWIASAMHASVNFGQYGYAGFLPNRPTMCRRFIPDEGTEEFAELLMDPDKFYLQMLPERFTATLGIALVEILSNHMTDEVYLGTRSSSKWTDNEAVLRLFNEFTDSLRWVERMILLKNREPTLKNRLGPAKWPYTLLYPDTTNDGSSGMTGKGIPNSVSI